MPRKGSKPVYSRKSVTSRNFPRLRCHILHAPYAAEGLREFKGVWKGSDELYVALTAELAEQCFEFILLTVHASTYVSIKNGSLPKIQPRLAVLAPVYHVKALPKRRQGQDSALAATFAGVHRERISLLDLDAAAKCSNRSDPDPYAPDPML